MKSKAFELNVLGQKEFLKAFALKLTKSNDLANDLIQDTLYRALKNEEKFRGGNLKAWLATIMRNLFINSQRSSKRIMDFRDDKEKDFLMIAHGDVAENSGEGTILMKELQKQVDLLHPDLRTPFMMVYKGYRYHEIAEYLQKPIGTIKSRVHIARKNLIRKLAQLYGEREFSHMVA